QLAEVARLRHAADRLGEWTRAAADPRPIVAEYVADAAVNLVAPADLDQAVRLLQQMWRHARSDAAAPPPSDARRQRALWGLERLARAMERLDHRKRVAVARGLCELAAESSG